MATAPTTGVSDRADLSIDRSDAATSAAPVTPVDRALARRVQRSIDAAQVRLELWDGSSPYRGRIASAISSRTIAGPCSASPSTPTFISVNAT